MKKQNAYTELSNYMEGVTKLLVLTREEEQKLCRKAQECKTKTARKSAQNKLVEHNLRFVVQVANQFKGYVRPGKIELMDLIQEGNAGLIKAAEKFDPEKGYRFVTYAVWWVRAFIQKYLLAQHSLVKIGTTQRQRKLFFRIGQIRTIMEIRGADERHDAREGLAKEFGVGTKDILEMEHRMGWNDLSLDNRTTDSKDVPNQTFKDMLIDESNRPEALEHRLEIEGLRYEIIACMDTLSNREKDIICTRWLSAEKVTLETLGNGYGISRERIRQIEVRALEKIRNNFSRQFPERQ